MSFRLLSASACFPKPWSPILQITTLLSLWIFPQLMGGKECKEVQWTSTCPFSESEWEFRWNRQLMPALSAIQKVDCSEPIERSRAQDRWT